MTLDAPTFNNLLTVAGNSALTALVCALIWRTAAAPSATVDRFGPIVAVGVGVVLAVLAGYMLNLGRGDIAQAALTGVFSGLASSGLYDVVKSKAGIA